MKNWPVMLLVLWGLISNAYARQSSYQDMVVMVDATYSASHPEFGAGIIVSETVQRTVIVTAAHVIETQGGELASNIQVEFRSLRGRTFKASVTRSYIDLKLDLAVLFVERQVNSDLPQELDPTALQVVSPSKPQSLVGSSVQVIGAMGKNGGRRASMQTKLSHLIQMNCVW